MRSFIITMVAGCSMALLLSAVSCTKKVEYSLPEQTNFNNESIIQVYLSMVNASRNKVFVDTKPLNGTLMTTGTLFPSTGPGAVVSGGLKSFVVRDTLSSSTQVPLVFSENLNAARSYTLFVYDTITAPKQKTVNTNIVVPADTTARLRFANFVYNPTVLDGFDIFSVKRNQVIFTNVRQTEVTDFIPYASNVTDTFLIRPTGSATNLQNWKTTAPTGFIDVIGVLTPSPKRSYTLIFRGGFRATATSNTTVRTLSTFINY